jgi:hypothetical protein
VNVFYIIYSIGGSIYIALPKKKEERGVISKIKIPQNLHSGGPFKAQPRRQFKERKIISNCICFKFLYSKMQARMKFVQLKHGDVILIWV